MVSEAKIDFGLDQRRIECNYFLEFFYGSNELALPHRLLAGAEVLRDLVLRNLAMRDWWSQRAQY